MVSQKQKEGWYSRMERLKKISNKIAEEMYGEEWYNESNPVTNLTCHFDEAMATIDGIVVSK